MNLCFRNLGEVRCEHCEGMNGPQTSIQSILSVLSVCQFSPCPTTFWHLLFRRSSFLYFLVLFGSFFIHFFCCFSGTLWFFLVLSVICWYFLVLWNFSAHQYLCVNSAIVVQNVYECMSVSIFAFTIYMHGQALRIARTRREVE